jgi:hypothetical protein
MYILTKSCKNCGKPFTPKRKHGVYCKESCRIAAYKKREGIPTPDFSMLKKIANLPTSDEIRRLNLLGLIAEASAKINAIEFSISKDMKHEEQYNLLVEKKRKNAEYEAGRAPLGTGKAWRNNVSEYDLSRYAEATAKGYEITRPRREELLELTKNIEKYRKELEVADHEIYISKNQTSNKLHTAASLNETEFDVLEFEGEWKTLLGRPERGFTAVIYGEKFSGKSTFALKLADYLTKFGTVIYFSVEEGVKMTMQNKLRTLGITNSKFNISAEQLPEAIMKMAKKFDFVIIDSLTTADISADDLRNAKLVSSKTAYIGINHITTDGRAKGGTGQLHNPDIVIKVEPIGKPVVEKNRYYIEPAFLE